VVAARQAAVQHGAEVQHTFDTTWRRSRSPCIRSASPTRLPRRPPRWPAGCTRQWTPSQPWPDAIRCRHVPTS
jgi:hypothetical protein